MSIQLAMAAASALMEGVGGSIMEEAKKAIELLGSAIPAIKAAPDGKATPALCAPQNQEFCKATQDKLLNFVKGPVFDAAKAGKTSIKAFLAEKQPNFGSGMDGGRGTDAMCAGFGGDFNVDVQQNSADQSTYGRSERRSASCSHSDL